MGRPTKYQPEYAEQAYKHCLAGAIDENLAEHFGIGVSTLSEWKLRYPEFGEAIKKGKAPADANVAHALYERATGCTWVEQQAIKCKRVYWEDGKRVEEEDVKLVDVTRHAPPDPTSMIFWLKNRQPRQWRDKTEVAVDAQSLADVAALMRGDIKAG